MLTTAVIMACRQLDVYKHHQTVVVCPFVGKEVLTSKPAKQHGSNLFERCTVNPKLRTVVYLTEYSRDNFERVDPTE